MREENLSKPADAAEYYREPSEDALILVRMIE